MQTRIVKLAISKETQTMMQEKQPFHYYRDGYIDGYYGVDPRAPRNEFYMNGYSEGKEDDRAGESSKFGDEMPKIEPQEVDPVTPSQCI